MPCHESIKSPIIMVFKTISKTNTATSLNLNNFGKKKKKLNKNPFLLCNMHSGFHLTMLTEKKSSTPPRPLQICLIFRLKVATKAKTIKAPKVKLPRQLLFCNLWFSILQVFLFFSLLFLFFLKPIPTSYTENHTHLLRTATA